MSDAIFQDFLTWLRQIALPLWASRGVDGAHGGFLERMMPDGSMTDDPRRARVSGRQIYVFSTAGALGFDQGDARRLVRHGLDWMLANHISDQNIIVPVVNAAGTPQHSHFDLYDQAFALFGFAAAASIGEDTQELNSKARILREHMLDGWKHPFAGFEEANPRSLPLKANPHMHMLEASLAWEAISDDSEWGNLTDELVELCLARFLLPPHGALHEFFDGDWRPMMIAPNDVVEPGHQAEWAWLLIRWGKSRNRPDAFEAARRLISIVEGPGKDVPQGLLVNELGPDLEIRDARMRLWPQTERIKALIALIGIAEDGQEIRKTELLLAEAVNGLMRFFEHPVAGSWWEHIGHDGKSINEPARASSLYHIVCAANELTHYLARKARH